MPLSVSDLQASIKKMIVTPPRDVPSLAQAWASAYDNYVHGMTTLPSSLIPAATQPALIQGSLESLAVAPAPILPLFPLQFNLGLIAYWEALVFLPGADTSVVSPGTTVALPTLAPVLLALPPVPDEDVAALALATQIDLWTRTVVIISINPESGTPIPNMPS